MNCQHEKFLAEYTSHWNATRAYLSTFPDSSYTSARSSAARLLKRPKIKAALSEYREFSRKKFELEQEVKSLRSMAAVWAGLR